jgi:hypothetical protein
MRCDALLLLQFSESRESRESCVITTPRFKVMTYNTSHLVWGLVVSISYRYIWVPCAGYHVRLWMPQRLPIQCIVASCLYHLHGC